MDTIVLIAITILAFTIAFVKDKSKTKKSMEVAKKMFQNTFLEVLTIMALVALFLSWIPASVIKNMLGNANEMLSIVLGVAIGTITIIPAFVAFPLAGSLLESGAHLRAIAAFITTLTMVGFATMPIEIKYFGRKFTFVRNGISILAALLIALGMGLIL